MESMYIHEALRADFSKFDQDFANYIGARKKEDWNVKMCTFFRDDNKMKKWAFCSFERGA